MHSPAWTIAFTLWLRHRRMLTAVVIYLALAAGLSALLGTPGLDAKPAVLVPLVMPCLFAACYLATVFAYAFECRMESRDSCFPGRMLTLPVRTAALAFWPMLYGTAALALVWLVTAQFIFRPWGVDVPLGWPALLAAVIVAWTQALLWCPLGLPWLRVVVAVLVLTVPVAGTINCLILQVPLAYLYAFLGVQLPAAYVTAYIGLAAARRGDIPGWGWLVAAFPRVLPRSSGRRRRFPSTARAQVWFEWRRHGIKAPAIVAILLPWFLLPLLFGKNPLLPTERTLAIALLAPLMASGMGINSVGKHNPWVKDYYGVSTFTATRPMTTAALVAAKLEMATWSALACWAVWLAGTLLALFLGDAHSEVLGWWDHLTQTRPAWEVAAALVAACVLLFALTWKNLVEGLCIGLTGREWVIKTATVVSMTLFCIVVWLGCLIVFNPGYQAFLLPVVPWALGTAVALKAALACWVGRALMPGLIPARTLFTLLGVWLGTAAGLIAIVVWLVPSLYAAPLTLAAGVMLSLPLVRVSATPLALAWDRHR